MAQLKDVLRAAGASIAESQWSAKATIQEQNEQARRLYQEGKINNFIIFDIGSVLPEGMSDSRMEHMFSFDYAYRIEVVRDWLFSQRRGLDR